MKRVIAPPPLIYIATFVPGWFLNRALAPPDLPLELRWGVADVCIAVAVYLAVSAIRTFRRAHTTPNPYGETTVIVSHGPFRHTRNPMYLALTLLYTGVAFALNAPLTLLLLPLALVAMHYGVILREEKYLEQKFGDEYRQYKARVRRWI